MSTTPDEQPKKDIAKKVVTPKRKYFFPAHSHLGEIEGDTPQEAETNLKSQLKQTQEEGDE